MSYATLIERASHDGASLVLMDDENIRLTVEPQQDECLARLELKRWPWPVVIDRSARGIEPAINAVIDAALDSHLLG